jgi:hypothetical protein
LSFRSLKHGKYRSVVFGSLMEQNGSIDMPGGPDVATAVRWATLDTITTEAS